MIYTSCYNGKHRKCSGRLDTPAEHYGCSCECHRPTRPMFPYRHPDTAEPVYCRVCGRPAVNDSYSNDEVCAAPACTAILVIEETLYAFTGELPEEV